jgi:chromosome segregation ATPase
VACLYIGHRTGLDSYARTGWQKIKANAKHEVPLEFEIDRVRQEVSRLVPEMQKHLGTIANEMVVVENLKDELAVTRANLKQQKENILTMRKDLETGAASFSYDNRSFSAARVRTKLARDFESYKRAEAELKTREQLLEAREQSLDAAREQLVSMKGLKQELEVRVAQLEAKLKTVRLAQTRNRFQFDDSHLARCKAMLADIENRLKVEERTNELVGEFANDAIPVEKKDKPATVLSKEIDSYFGEQGAVADKK